VALSQISSQVITVDYSTIGLVAIAGDDFVPNTATLTFNPGETQQFITVTVIGDALNEDPETFQVHLDAVTNAALGARTALGTILDDDPPPVVSVQHTSGSEGEGQLVFTVALDAPSGKTITVDYQTANGTAIAPADYLAIPPSTLTFAPGETQQLITVTVIDDLLDEPDETLQITLTNGTHVTLGSATATGTILDNDLPPITSIQDAVGREADGLVVFTVELDAPSARPITITYRTANDTAIAPADFTAVTNGSITFAPGDTQQFITITVINDALDEDDEQFRVELSGESNVRLGQSVAVGTILDNDIPPILSVGDVTALEGDGDRDGVAIFTLSLNAPSGRTITVEYQFTNGSAIAPLDYVAPPPGTLTFQPGEVVTFLTVPLIDDRLNEDNETFQLELSNPTHVTLERLGATGTILDNDAPPVIQIQDAIAPEQAGQIIFTLNLSAPSGRDITVNYRTEDGTALGSTHYTPILATPLTFVAGETRQLVTVTIADDDLDNDDRRFQLRLNGPTHASLERTAALGTIQDDDLPPTYRISDLTVLENSGAAVFTVSLDRPSDREITLDYRTENGTATAGEDYIAVANGRLTFAPGTTTQLITIALVADDRDEDDETVEVLLGNATHAIPGITRAIATIQDDDLPSSLSATGLSVAENAGQALLTLRLDRPSGRLITVNYTTIAGSATAGNDYLPITGTLTFTPGQTQQILTVPLVNDATFELDETFQLALSDISGATLATPTVTVTILNDDPQPTITILNASVLEGDEGLTLVPVTVRLSNPSAQLISLTYETTDDTAQQDRDYQAASGNLIFNPGETEQILTLTVIGDRAYETNERFNVLLRDPVNATLGSDRASITLLNDDALPEITLEDITVLEGDSSIQNAVFTVQVNGSTNLPIQFDYITQDGSAIANQDYLPIQGQFTIPAGQTQANLTVSVVGDRIFEGNETFTLSLTNITNADPTPITRTATIVDDDAPPQIRIVNLRTPEGDRGRDDALVRVELSNPSSERITVDYATTNRAGSRAATAEEDYLPRQGTLTFQPGEAVQTIAVPIIGDRFFERNERFLVNLTNPQGASIERNRGVVTIVNDDSQPILRMNNVRIQEGDRGSRTATVVLRLNRASNLPVLVRYRTLDDTATVSDGDYVQTRGSLVFDPGQTRQVVRIPILGDRKVEPNEQFKLQLTTVRGALVENRTATITILNDDTSARARQVADGIDLMGDQQANRLTGTRGDDRLVGRGGDDILLGRSGNDRLIGGRGNDILIGGNGENVLTGGPGRDTFRFTQRNRGPNLITDFDVEQDTIDLQDFFADDSRRKGTIFRQDIDLVDTGNNTSVFVSGRSQPLMILRDINANQITAAQFLL
jgi:Ca2+-binding RTX toxin-like protein